MTVADFLKQAKAKAIVKAKKMAKLEMSVWDANHEKELKAYFGFNDKSLAVRKAELEAASK